MQSSIKIDFIDNGKGAGLEPVIKVSIIDTDDIRDKMLKTFFQELGGESSWLRVEIGIHPDSSYNGNPYLLYPVKPSEFPKEIEEMKGRLRQSGETVAGTSTRQYGGAQI